MTIKTARVFGLVALLVVSVASAARAGSDDEPGEEPTKSCDQGNFRDGDKVRIKARVNANGRWDHYVYRPENAKVFSNSDYHKMSSLEVSVDGEWSGYFHLRQLDKNYKPSGWIRCNIKGKSHVKGSGDLKVRAIRFDEARCFTLKPDDDGDLVGAGEPLPVKVNCRRSFNPDAGRLTVKLSFDPL